MAAEKHEVIVTLKWPPALIKHVNISFKLIFSANRELSFSPSCRSYLSNKPLPFEPVATARFSCPPSNLLPQNSAIIVLDKWTIIQLATFQIIKPNFQFFIGIDMASPAIKLCKSIDPREDHLADLDASIQETRFTLASLSQIKQTILNNSDIISDSFCSSLS